MRAREGEGEGKKERGGLREGKRERGRGRGGEISPEIRVSAEAAPPRARAERRLQGTPHNRGTNHASFIVFDLL
jgi:hypothetical protein